MSEAIYLSDATEKTGSYEFQSHLFEISKLLSQNMGDGPTKKVRELFDRLDANNNGSLSRDELEQLLIEMGKTQQKNLLNSLNLDKPC